MVDNFKVGDVVTLKSGSKKMTINAIYSGAVKNTFYFENPAALVYMDSNDVIITTSLSLDTLIKVSVESPKV